MSPSIAVPRSYQYFPHFAPRVPVTPRSSGMGSLTPAQLAQQIGAITGSAATGAVAALSLAGVITSATASALIPIIGPAIAGITLGISAILNSGCGQTCIVTSNWANQAEQLLQQNIAAYFALPEPRSQSAKNIGLANFDNVWNYLSQQCGQQALGTAGVNCVKDRQAGACTWKQTATSSLLQYPGEPQPGQCWNWFNGYRDPIANDLAVPDSQAPSAAGVPGSGASLGTPATDWGTFALYGGIALLAAGLIGGMN